PTTSSARSFRADARQRRAPANPPCRAFAAGALPQGEAERERRPAQKFAAGLGLGGGAAEPFGRANMRPGRRSTTASSSEAVTTSAYLAFMSQRLMAWLACERSKQPSSANAIR